MVLALHARDDPMAGSGLASRRTGPRPARVRRRTGRSRPSSTTRTIPRCRRSPPPGCVAGRVPLPDARRRARRGARRQGGLRDPRRAPGPADAPTRVVAADDPAAASGLDLPYPVIVKPARHVCRVAGGERVQSRRSRAIRRRCAGDARAGHRDARIRRADGASQVRRPASTATTSTSMRPGRSRETSPGARSARPRRATATAPPSRSRRRRSERSGRECVSRLDLRGVAKLDFKRDPGGPTVAARGQPEVLALAPARSPCGSQPPGAGIRRPHRSSRPSAEARPRRHDVVRVAPGLQAGRPRTPRAPLGRVGPAGRCEAVGRLGRPDAVPRGHRRAAGAGAGRGGTRVVELTHLRAPSPFLPPNPLSGPSPPPLLGRAAMTRRVDLRVRTIQVVGGPGAQLQVLPVGVIFGVQNMQEPKPLITLLATVRNRRT